MATTYTDPHAATRAALRALANGCGDPSLALTLHVIATEAARPGAWAADVLELARQLHPDGEGRGVAAQAAELLRGAK